MKTKVILATLLVAAATADARFAWPYPPKAVSPDEIGHWLVINGNAWPNSPLFKRTWIAPTSKSYYTPSIRRKILNFLKCRSSND